MLRKGKGTAERREWEKGVLSSDSRDGEGNRGVK